MRIVISILAAALLSGCATTGSGVTVLTPTVPASLLQCKGQPSAPRSGTQRDVGLYVTALADAGQDCRQNLNSDRGLLDDPETTNLKSFQRSPRARSYPSSSPWAGGSSPL